MPPAPDALIVGPVTWDRFQEARRPGGAVLFAARVARAMGVRAAVLTVAASDAELTALDDHELRVVPSAHTLTFAHMFSTAGERELRVLQQAVPIREPASAAPTEALRASDVPADWLAARDVILAPLLPADVDLASFTAASARVALAAQGLQRGVGGDGAVRVLPSPAEALLAACTPSMSIFLSAPDIAGWSQSDLDAVVARVERLVITRGSAGATVHRGHGRIEVPPCPAEAIDVTGAGDVFATAFILGVGSLGLDDFEAGRLASAYAAASVELLGPAPLPPLSDMQRRAGIAAGSVRR